MGIKQLWDAELIYLYHYVIIGILFNVDMLGLMKLPLHSVMNLMTNEREC